MKKVLFVFFTLLVLIGCPNPGPDTAAINSDNEILSFGFRADENPSLSIDVEGTISGRRIYLIVPFGTDLSTLVANFELSGGSAYVDGTAVRSGSTILDYSRLVVMRVTASDGTNADYRILVTEEADQSRKDLLSFEFSAANNTELSEDYSAEIEGTDVTLNFPPGVALNNLVATFRSSGKTVSIGTTRQISGTTENDFSSPLVYRVTANDGSTKDYNVNITVAPLELSSFSFLASANPSLTQDYHGVIQGSTIDFTLPYDADYTNLIASYETTALEVRVGLTTQSSGITSNDFNESTFYVLEGLNSYMVEYSVQVAIAVGEQGLSTGAALGDQGTIHLGKSGETINLILAKEASMTGSLTGPPPFAEEVTLDNRTYWFAETEFTNAQAVEVLQWAINNERLSILSEVHNSINGRQAQYNFSTILNFANQGNHLIYDEITATISAEGGFEDFPLTNVSLYGAILLCNWLTEMRDGNTDNLAYNVDETATIGWTENLQATGYRIPDQNTWEFVARYQGSNSVNAEAYPPIGTTLYYLTNWDSASGAQSSTSASTNQVAVSANQAPSPLEAAVTGSLGINSVNHLGLYDMSGNLWEWTSTEYMEGPSHTDMYFCRGGSWNSLDVSFDASSMPYSTDSSGEIGFRICRTAE